MAIPYAGVRFIGREGGGNAVRSAAYNARERITGEKVGENFNFSDRRQEALHHDILLPAGADPSFRNPERLWRAVEAAEKRKDARVAKEVLIALPTDPGVTKRDWIVLTEGFAREQFVSRGVAAQINIHHDKADNPHAHILITTRRIEGDRLASHKARDLDPIVRRGVKGRAFVTEAQMFGKAWADHQDRYFRERGSPVRVDPVAIVPGRHIGPVRHRKPADKNAKHDAALQKANAALIQDPRKIIEALTRNKATFDLNEVSRLLHKAGMDRPEAEAMKARVRDHTSVLPLYDPKTGELNGRYTTHAIRAQERHAMAVARMVADSHHPAIALKAPARLREDQRKAFDSTLAAGGLKLIEGRAGTGKTTTLSAIRDAHEAAGYRVVGMAPTNTVASDMRIREGFAEARTAHSWLFRLKNDRDQWDRRTTVILDEGAMVSAPIMGEILGQVRQSGAKLIIAGDDRQLPSIERGGLFSEMVRAHGSAEITGVIRQHEEWQRQASMDLAAGRFHSAVDKFQEAGAISWSEDRPHALAALVGAWARDTKAEPDKTRFAFAWTNDDVDRLNAEMRAVRVGRGELGEVDHVFQTRHGKATFAVGDRVQFTATQKPLGIQNGETATIISIRSSGTLRSGLIEARTDRGDLVRWNPREVDGFRHGYAGTIYRGQGQSLDATYILHSVHWRAPAAYVALTRQRESIKLFVAESIAPNARELAEQMGRPEQRSASLRWEDNREDAQKRMAEIILQERDAERLARRERTAQPAGSDLEFHARQVVQGWADYLDVLDLQITKEMATIPKGAPPEAWDHAHDRAANKLQWALDRAEAWLAEVRADWTPQQWARAIERGAATDLEAIQAVVKNLDGEDAAYRATRAVMDAKKQQAETVAKVEQQPAMRLRR